MTLSVLEKNTKITGILVDQYITIVKLKDTRGTPVQELGELGHLVALVQGCDQRFTKDCYDGQKLQVFAESIFYHWFFILYF